MNGLLLPIIALLTLVTALIAFVGLIVHDYLLNDDADNLGDESDITHLEDHKNDFR